MKSKALRIFYPNYFNGKAISYVCLSVAEEMNKNGFDVSVMGICSAKNITTDIYKDAIPRILNRIAYMFLSHSRIQKIAEKRFFKSLSPGDIVYLWPSSSVSLHKKVKDLKCVIVNENINTHVAYALKILEDEYKRLNVTHGLTVYEKKSSIEKQINKYTDYYFSPSPIVTHSLLANNIPESSIMQTSYGLRDEDILQKLPDRNYSDNGEITVIFVGQLSIRKGIHLLLEVWKKAEIQGKLLLIGNIDENIKDIVVDNLCDSIIHIPYTDDLSSIYKNADVFMLPSLEEGSPLVTYLALGSGLPSIVSPMGGGGIINSATGYIISPHDTDSWVETLRLLSKNGSTRKKIGESALSAAENYTWSKVGLQRTRLLLEKLNVSTG